MRRSTPEDLQQLDPLVELNLGDYTGTACRTPVASASSLRFDITSDSYKKNNFPPYDMRVVLQSGLYANSFT